MPFDSIINALPLAPVRTVPPTLKLFELDEIKAHLRVDTNDEDDLIEALRDTVVAHLDGWSGILGRALLTQTWRQDLAQFPPDYRIRLPLMPVSAISGITYFDLATNLQQTLSTAVYAGPFVDSLGPYLALVYGQIWPNTYLREDAVSITFVVGNISAAAVPKPIRQAALMMIGDMFENRETVQVGDRAAALEIPTSMTIERLLGPYRRTAI